MLGENNTSNSTSYPTFDKTLEIKKVKLLTNIYF